MGLVYKYNIKKSFPHLRGLLFVFIGAFLFIAFKVYSFANVDTGVFFLYAFAFFFGFSVFPTLVIHFSYYLYCRSDVLEIDFEMRIICYQHNGKKHSFAFDDILHIDKYVTFPKARNAVGWAPWDTFNYTVLTLTNKKVLITCYLVEDIEKSISSKKVNIHTVFFPVLPLD